MAKYRRYRKYSRRSIAKWSPNIQEIDTTTVVAPAASVFYQSFVLSFNPTQVNTAVSQIYTVKRIECSFYIDTDDNSQNQVLYLEDIAAYIMFVPQGMTVTADYNTQHPEYIMAYKFLGGPSLDISNNATIGQQYQPIKVTTRLSRKLNSGDSVILFIKGNNTSQNQNSNFQFHGLIRWWTRAN